MSKKKNKAPVEPVEPIDDEGTVVEMTDDEGNVFLYTEEMVIPIDDERYALLLSMDEDESEDEEPEVIIAKIIVDENGEDLYVEPTDEEFERAREAYDKLFDEETFDEDATG